MLRALYAARGTHVSKQLLLAWGGMTESAFHMALIRLRRRGAVIHCASEDTGLLYRMDAEQADAMLLRSATRRKLESKKRPKRARPSRPSAAVPKPSPLRASVTPQAIARYMAAGSASARR